MVTSGAGDTYTVNCRGSNEACFAEAQRRCPHGYETVQNPSRVSGRQPGLFGGDDDDDDGFASNEVNEMRVICNTSDDSSGITESIRAKELEDKAQNGASRTLPPEGGAGFFFDRTLSETREACEGAGHTLDGQTCSGVARDVGVPAQARFGFCGGRLCMIVVEAKLGLDDGAGWKNEFVDARKALIAKYGPESAKRVRWPAGCQEAHEVVGCLQAATAHFRYEWAWDSGHGIVLAMGRSANSKQEGDTKALATPSLRVTFSSPATRDARAPAGL